MAVCTVVRLLVIFSVLSRVLSIDMYVEVEDDDGHRQRYNISKEMEELMREEPPFHIPDKEMEKDYKTKMRPRRDITMMEDMAFTRKLPKCEEYVKNYRLQTEQAPMQLMYSVQVGEDVKMKCHYCGDKEVYGKTIEWKRLAPNKIDKSYFLIVAVKMDTHDDNSANRIFLDEDYNLHIRRVTDADRGTYFCNDLKTNDPHVAAKLDIYQLKDFFYSTTKFKVYFHLEVIFPSDVPVRRVDSNGEKFPKPLPEETLEEDPLKGKADNLIYYTNWGDWTQCSVCGEEGEMKRLGICTARIWNLAYMTLHFEHIYYVLKAYQPGLPCRSSLFQGYTRMLRRNRSDELEIKKCKIPCAKGMNLGKPITLTDPNTGTLLSRKVPEKTVHVIEASRVDLTCPGSTIDTLVYWVNGTQYMSSLELRRITKNRVDIDAYNVFVIKKVILTDAGMYTCWFAGKRQIVFYLSVSPLPGTPPWVEHLIYLCYSFTVDFWIFVILLVIKHKHRLVVRNTNEENIPEEPETQEIDREADEEGSNEND